MLRLWVMLRRNQCSGITLGAAQHTHTLHSCPLTLLPVLLYMYWKLSRLSGRGTCLSGIPCMASSGTPLLMTCRQHTQHTTPSPCQRHEYLYGRRKMDSTHRPGAQKHACSSVRMLLHVVRAGAWPVCNLHQQSSHAHTWWCRAHHEWYCLTCCTHCTWCTYCCACFIHPAKVGSRRTPLRVAALC